MNTHSIMTELQQKKKLEKARELLSYLKEFPDHLSIWPGRLQYLIAKRDYREFIFPEFKKSIEEIVDILQPLTSTDLEFRKEKVSTARFNSPDYGTPKTPKSRDFYKMEKKLSQINLDTDLSEFKAIVVEILSMLSDAEIFIKGTHEKFILVQLAGKEVQTSKEEKFQQFVDKEMINARLFLAEKKHKIATQLVEILYPKLIPQLNVNQNDILAWFVETDIIYSKLIFSLEEFLGNSNYAQQLFYLFSQPTKKEFFLWVDKMIIGKHSGDIEYKVANIRELRPKLLNQSDIEVFMSYSKKDYEHFENRDVYHSYAIKFSAYLAQSTNIKASFLNKIWNLYGFLNGALGQSEKIENGSFVPKQLGRETFLELHKGNMQAAQESIDLLIEDFRNRRTSDELKVYFDDNSWIKLYQQMKFASHHMEAMMKSLANLLQQDQPKKELPVKGAVAQKPTAEPEFKEILETECTNEELEKIINNLEEQAAILSLNAEKDEASTRSFSAPGSQ